jgi:intein/homing endonuclease
MPRMTWEYLAGFFDGEGCLQTTALRRPYLSVAQSQPRGRQLLEEIKQFLVEQGVTPTKIASVGYTRSKRRHRTQRVRHMHYLVITRRQDVALICRGMFPYLRIKKIEAQDTLRFVTLFPLLRPWGRPPPTR